MSPQQVGYVDHILVMGTNINFKCIYHIYLACKVGIAVSSRSITLLMHTVQYIDIQEEQR